VAQQLALFSGSQIALTASGRVVASTLPPQEEAQLQQLIDRQGPPGDRIARDNATYRPIPICFSVDTRRSTNAGCLLCPHVSEASERFHSTTQQDHLFSGGRGAVARWVAYWGCISDHRAPARRSCGRSRSARPWRLRLLHQSARK